MQDSPPRSVPPTKTGGPVAHVIGSTDPLRTEAEAAQHLGVSPKTLSVWRCTKRYPLPYVKIGSRVRYRQSALDAFIASRTQSGGGAE